MDKRVARIGKWHRMALKIKRLVFNVGDKNKQIRTLQEKVDKLELQLKKQSNDMDQAKNHFLKNVYHEIRTPLNAIIGFMDLVEMFDTNSTTKATYTNHIKNSSVKFLEKIDDIIEASIIQAGMLKITKTPCNLFELLSEVYVQYTMQKHIIEKNIAFLLNIPPKYRDIIAVCDEYRIKQIISHLLSNAFKFTQQGVIEFGFDIVDSDIQFYVKDSGIGGIADKEEQVFDSFTRLNNSDLGEEGMGLGLHLSKNIVELHNGKIWYESSEKNGTTVYFTIPYHPDNTSEKSRNKNEIYQHKSTLRRRKVRFPKVSPLSN